MAIDLELQSTVGAGCGSSSECHAASSEGVVLGEDDAIEAVAAEECAECGGVGEDGDECITQDGCRAGLGCRLRYRRYRFATDERQGTEQHEGKQGSYRRHG